MTCIVTVYPRRCRRRPLIAIRSGLQLTFSTSSSRRSARRTVVQRSLYILKVTSWWHYSTRRRSSFCSNRTRITRV